MKRLRTFITLALLPVFVSSASAQSAQRAAPPVVAPAPPREAPPPYEPQLLRLAEIMGALAWLRDVCGLQDGDQWRQRMSALLEAEATTDTRKERLAGAYNKGFRSYEAVYRTCTANAELVIARYLEEGKELAHEITNRFGGG
jgi:uncharacterized protein (TIGR02301 family)